MSNARMIEQRMSPPEISHHPILHSCQYYKVDLRTHLLCINCNMLALLDKDDSGVLLVKLRKGHELKLKCIAKKVVKGYVLTMTM